MKLSNQLRLIWAGLTRSGSNGFAVVRLMHRRFHGNGSKIIGWHQGCPSFTLMAPPTFSSPVANSIATRLMSLYQNRPLPEMVDIAVTDQCQCSCAHCSFEGMRKATPVLERRQLRETIRQAQDLGVATINFVGGEPLLRDDLCDLVRSVDPERSQVILFTNGWLLKERARALAAAGVTSVITSLDAPAAAEHDRIRGLRGLFDRAVAGIREAQRQGLLTGLSTIMGGGQFKEGRLDEMMELARRLKVNELILFEAVPNGTGSCKQHLEGDSIELTTLRAAVERYALNDDFPGLYAYPYVRSHLGLGCAGGVAYFYVSPTGDVCPCDFSPRSVGNVKDEPLFALWERLVGREKCSGLNGCKAMV